MVSNHLYNQGAFHGTAAKGRNDPYLTMPHLTNLISNYTTTVYHFSVGVTGASGGIKYIIPFRWSKNSLLPLKNSTRIPMAVLKPALKDFFC